MLPVVFSNGELFASLHALNGPNFGVAPPALGGQLHSRCNFRCVLATLDLWIERYDPCRVPPLRVFVAKGLSLEQNERAWGQVDDIEAWWNFAIVVGGNLHTKGVDSCYWGTYALRQS